MSLDRANPRQGMGDFLYLVQNHPDVARALASAVDVRLAPAAPGSGSSGLELRSGASGEGAYIADYVQTVASSSDPDDRRRVWLEVANMVKLLFPRAEATRNFLRTEGLNGDRVFVTLTDRHDHNGALSKGSIGGQEYPTRIPHAELPPESWGNVVILNAHGYTRKTGPDNDTTAEAIAQEIIQQRKAGRTIDRVICNSCSQRDPRKIGHGWSNGWHLQQLIDSKLKAAGVDQVPVYTADKPGLVAYNTLTDRVVNNNGVIEPTDFAPAAAPTQEEMLQAFVSNVGVLALAALASFRLGGVMAPMLDQLPSQRPSSSMPAETGGWQPAPRNNLERLNNLDLAYKHGETPEVRNKARDELVNLARHLARPASASPAGEARSDAIGVRRNVDALVTEMAKRYGLDAASFVGPGGKLEAFPDALAEKLDAGLKASPQGHGTPPLR